MATATIKRELITQGKAFNLLNNNYGKQRKISDDWVSILASDMENGNWDDGAVNPIKITKDGKLIDGQHRLMAVLESGKNIWFWVARGCDEGEFVHTDENKTRKAGQFCDRKNANSLCALAKVVIALEKGNPAKSTFNGRVRVPVSRVEITQRANNDDAINKACTMGVKMRNAAGIGSTATYSLFAYLVNECFDDNQIEQFVDDFASIDMPNKTAASAKLLIAKTAANSKTRNLDKMWLIGTLVSAYRHYIKADDVTRIGNQTSSVNWLAETVSKAYGLEE